MQQINLYLPEFRPNREPLRSVHMVWGLVALLVLLLLFALFSGYRNGQLRADVAVEQAAVAAVQLQLQELSLQQPQNIRVQLDVEIQQLQSERDRREQILTIISRQDLGNTMGFSAQVRALARQSLDTLALERISLQRGGNYVEFSGTARSADQIPIYIQRLRTEASFADVNFGVLRVERAGNSGAPLNFQLAKAQEDKTLGGGDYFEGKR